MTDVAAVSCAGLGKVYRLGVRAKKVRALQGVSLTVAPGEVFGLIGPNGAGKSTTIKILLNLITATEGEAKLFGVDVRDRKARVSLGYVPESPSPYEHLTGREYVEFQAALAGISGPERTKEVHRVLERVELGPLSRVAIRRYSKGMVQRVMLAGALLGHPRLLVLDEPTSGLDPLGRRLVREVILEQRRAGAAVLFCSHIISDVESLCDRVALLVGGNIKREGRVGELISGSGRTHEVVVDAAASEVQSLVGALVEGLEEVSGQAMFRVGSDGLQRVLHALVTAGKRVERVQPIRFSLEDTFLAEMQSTASRVGGSLE
ncbi:MAG: ABC transporter ATP-binding protein [Myxococcota bacterium]|jgi:ABC-2 type transport system ATP-binding protein